ncbi:WecB/TagA/CpsF family glycosyltransferase [bacterium]|nr:WecB/TagA/CpsF family glycosyltransferase [bacterium]
MTEKVRLLGYDIDTFDFEGAIQYAKEHSGQVVTINPEMMSNPDLQDIVNSSELVIPDGIGVQLGLLIKGYNIRRIPGIQFAHTLLKECAKLNQKVALIGAKPEILEAAVKNLKAEIENLNIVYCENGYFKDENLVLQELQKCEPRLVLCALGSPKQELFINNAKRLLKESIFIGVGGSFDVWAGVVKRAPKFWQVLGLEWLYRTIKEPKRLKRIFPTLPLFVFRVLNERFRGN